MSPETDGVKSTCVSSNDADALTEIPSALVAACEEGDEGPAVVVFVAPGAGVVVIKIGGGGGGGGGGAESTDICVRKFGATALCLTDTGFAGMGNA